MPVRVGIISGLDVELVVNATLQTHTFSNDHHSLDLFYTKRGKFLMFYTTG